MMVPGDTPPPLGRLHRDTCSPAQSLTLTAGGTEEAKPEVEELADTCVLSEGYKDDTITRPPKRVFLENSS